MENKNIELKIQDYSLSPGPHYCYQGDDSGENFYHERLNPLFAKAIESNSNLIVDLDGPDGYASSFLDEAFGNLVYDFGKTIVEQFLIIKSREEPEWYEMLKQETFVEWEQRRKKGNIPLKTNEHTAWFRYDNGMLISKIWLQPNSAI